MPRHLPRALAHLAALSPQRAAHDPYDPLSAYLAACWSFALLGIELPLRDQILELWKHRPDLRDELRSFVDYYPCDEFLRPMCRAVEKGGEPDFAAWLERYPELESQLAPHVIERTKQFNQPWLALKYGMIWARYFHGGDEAFRQIALAIKRSDRQLLARQRKLEPWERFDDLRHHLEDHGELNPAEAEALNRHLELLGQEPIPVQKQGMSWHWLPIDCYRAEDMKGYNLARLAERSRAFAGADWSDEDEAFYAGRLARLSDGARPSFRNRDRFTDGLERIWQRASNLR
jgi:hypothetical protein